MRRAVRPPSLLGPLFIAILSAAFITTGCAEPPHKEMNQAQGAIDAARSAGADKFAGGELTAAIDALKRSEEAATGGDYRQALNHALDSRERAQNAAKLAVDGRADARGRAEASVAELATLLSRAQRQLADLNDPRLNSRLRASRSTVVATEKKLQDARTALKTEDYPTVAATLAGAATDLQAALAAIDVVASTRPAPRKR